VTGAKAFNDKSFVTNVLDRVHRERGVAEIRYCSAVRTTYYADRWAQSRRVRVRCVRPAEIFRLPAQGVVAFDGPYWFVDQATDAGFKVWWVKRRGQGGTLPVDVVHNRCASFSARSSVSIIRSARAAFRLIETRSKRYPTVAGGSNAL
jgi:hypothetical protein